MLQTIFEPASIAIIGASSTPGKWGHSILKNIIEGGYQGRVYPVNHREPEVLGMPAYKSILEVTQPVELAIIAVPAKAALKVAEECGRKGVKGIIAITAGFSEIGGEGIELEKKLIETVKKYNMRLLGPNTLGVVNAHLQLNASITSQMPKPGNISFITQSGTLGLALTDWTVATGLGLRIVVSTGNKANIDDVDLLEYLNNDEHTQVIAMYIEGINRGREFIRTARRIQKPIIALKTGRSKRGLQAVFSHTGSLAGTDEIYTAAFKQAGILRASTIDEIFDAALALSTQPPPAGNNVGIISNGGGASILASDKCEEHHLNIPDLTPETREKLKQNLPPFASTQNPVDMAGLSTYTAYHEAIKAMLQDPNIHSMIIIYVHTAMTSATEPAKALVEIKANCTKPVIACWMGGKGTEEGTDMLKAHSIPNYPVPERAVWALASLIHHKEALEVKTTA